MRSSSFTRRSGCLLQILLLLLFYVLSYAPVQALYSSGRIDGSFPGGLSAFYQPVTWLRDNTALGPAMESYAAWWLSLLTRD